MMIVTRTTTNRQQKKRKHKRQLILSQFFARKDIFVFGCIRLSNINYNIKLYLCRPLRLLPTALALKSTVLRGSPDVALLVDTMDACADAIGRFLKPCNFFSVVSSVLDGGGDVVCCILSNVRGVKGLIVITEAVEVDKGGLIVVVTVTTFGLTRLVSVIVVLEGPPVVVANVLGRFGLDVYR